MPKFLASVDMTQREIQRAVNHPLASAPASPVEGQGYYDTVMKQERYWNGTTWVTPGNGMPAGGLLGQALTKKTGTDFDTQWSNLPTNVERFVSATPNVTVNPGATTNVDIVTFTAGATGQMIVDLVVQLDWMSGGTQLTAVDLGPSTPAPTTFPGPGIIEDVGITVLPITAMWNNVTAGQSVTLRIAVGVGTTGTSPIKVGQVYGTYRIAGVGDSGAFLPVGGTTGQSLVKNSGANYDATWQSVTAGVSSVDGRTGVVTLADKYVDVTGDNMTGPLQVRTPTTLDANAEVTVAANSTGRKPLVLQGIAGQTANLLEAQASTGGPLAYINSLGSVAGTDFRLNGAKYAVIGQMATPRSLYPFMTGTWADRFQHSTISNCEYWDGSAWAALASTTVQEIFSGHPASITNLNSTTYPKWRVTFSGVSSSYAAMLFIYQEYGPPKGYKVTLEESADGVAWTTLLAETTVADNTYYATIPTTISYGNYHRLTIEHTTPAFTYIWKQIRFFSDRMGGPGGQQIGLPFTWQYNKDVRFPTNVGVGTNPTTQTRLTSYGSGNHTSGSGNFAIKGSMYWTSSTDTTSYIQGNLLLLSTTVPTGMTHTQAATEAILGSESRCDINGDGNYASAASGIMARINRTGTGTLSVAKSFLAYGPTISGGGTIGTAIGLDISTQKNTGVTTGYGVKQNGAADYNYFAGYIGLNVLVPTARLHLAADTLATGGILFGTDTNLYRTGADSLKTDDSFTVGGTLNVNTAMTAPILTGTQNTTSVNAFAAGTALSAKQLNATANNWTELAFLNSTGLVAGIGVKHIDQANRYGDMYSYVRSAAGWYPRLKIPSIGGLDIYGDNNSVVASATNAGMLTALAGFRHGDTTKPSWTVGTGTPEGAVVAPVGSLWSRTDGSTGTAFYRKETGAGNTGWVPASMSVGGLPAGGSTDSLLVKNTATDYDTRWAPYLNSITIGATSATTGAVRLPANSSVYARDSSNVMDLPLIGLSALNDVVVGGSQFGIMIGNSSTTKFGIGGISAARSTGWNVTSGYAALKTLDPSTTTLAALARVVGTLVDVLKGHGIVLP